jgi:hypothetical protein
MKKIFLFLLISSALVGFAIPKIVQAVACQSTTCYAFDSLSSVTAGNLSFNGVHVTGLVGGIEKTVTFLLDIAVDPTETEALNHCFKNALLAQVSPDKFQLVIQSNQAESNNVLTITPPATAAYLCSLVSK